MGSLRVRHDRVTSLSLFTFIHWRRKWQPTPVFLPGESQGRGSLVSCHLWVAQSWTRLKRLSRSSSGTRTPTQVEDGNFRPSPRSLEQHPVASPPTNQKGSQTLQPSPQCCLLFPGTRDDHPVRSPVWLLSISSLRGPNSFKLNCCYYKGGSWFQMWNTPT